MPAGTDVTTPLPEPAFVTENATGLIVNVADTVLAVSNVKVHGPIPEQSPAQPVKSDEIPGVATKVTVSPYPTGDVHVALHSTAAGTDETVPRPLPLMLKLSGNETGASESANV